MLDPRTHRIYPATGERNVAGTFKILAYGMEKTGQ